MNSRGFTLIELLGTVTLLSLVAILVYPNVVEQIEKKQKDVDEAKLEIIYSGTKDYVLRNSDEYPQIVGKNYCILLDDIDNSGLISIEIDDVKKEYKGIEIKIGKNNNYTYKLVSNCS